MTQQTDCVIVFCFVAVLLVIDAVRTILSISKKGIFIDEREVLLSKTNKELRTMLKGIKNISNKNKSQLVELVLTTS